MVDNEATAKYAAEWQLANEEVQEQRYRFFRDVVLAVGVEEAVGSITFGASAGLYDVQSGDIESWIVRMGHEGHDFTGNSREVPQAVADRERWLTFPNMVDLSEQDFAKQILVALFDEFLSSDDK